MSFLIASCAWTFLFNYSGLMRDREKHVVSRMECIVVAGSSRSSCEAKFSSFLIILTRTWNVKENVWDEPSIDQMKIVSWRFQCWDKFNHQFQFIWSPRYFETWLTNFHRSWIHKSHLVSRQKDELWASAYIIELSYFYF